MFCFLKLYLSFHFILASGSDMAGPSIDPNLELYERSSRIFITFRHVHALLMKRGINFIRSIKGAIGEVSIVYF